MSSPDEDWWSLRAAEYVIGTLRGDDLDLFQRILAHDVEVQAKVARWESRLQPLNADTAAVEPPAAVWPRIAKAIQQQAAEEVNQNDNPMDSPAVDVHSIDDAVARDDSPVLGAAGREASRNGSMIWPTIAMLATAASLVMGVLLNQQRALTIDAPGAVTEQTFRFTSDGTSIVSDDAGTALWLVQTDHEVGLLRVTALAPPVLEGSNDYQLWQVLPDDQGVASVGVLPVQAGQVVDYVATAFESGADAFAVSQEPEGGSPDLIPSGPVLFQGIYRATIRDAITE